MFRVIGTVACFLLLCIVGCGKSEPTKGGQELNDQQNNAQQKVDNEERQMQQSQK